MPKHNVYLKALETPWYKSRWGIFAGIVLLLIAVALLSGYGIGSLALLALPVILCAAFLSADEQLREHQT
jgi:preprotein translocase subunit SecD